MAHEICCGKLKSQIELHSWLINSLGEETRASASRHSPKTLNKGYLIEKEDKSEWKQESW